MNVDLAIDHEDFVRSLVRGGRYASEAEVIGEALRLLRRSEERERTRVLEGIRNGLEDIEAGRTQPLDEAFADIRRDLEISQAP